MLWAAAAGLRLSPFERNGGNKPADPPPCHARARRCKIRGPVEAASTLKKGTFFTLILQVPAAAAAEVRCHAGKVARNVTFQDNVSEVTVCALLAEVAGLHYN